MTLPRLSILKTLWPYMRQHRLIIMGAALATLISASTVLGLGQGVKHLIDDGFAAGDTSMLNNAALILLGVIGIMALSSYGRLYFVNWLGERVVARLREDVFAHLITLSPEFYERNRSGEITTRITTDTTLVQTVVSSAVPITIRNLLMITGGSALMFLTSWKLALLVFAGVPVILVPIILFGRRVRALSRRAQDEVAHAGAYLEESLSAIRTVQAFTHEAEDNQHFGEHVRRAFVAAVARIRHRAFLASTVISLVFGAITLIIWVGGHDVIAGRISAGELTTFVFYAVVVAGSVGALSEIIGDIQRASGALDRLMELLATASPVTSPATTVSLPAPVRGALAFESVRFAYPLAPEKEALQDITFNITSGERVAFVGASGAGKSTIFQLLLRFYDPTHGVIRLDGINIRTLHLQDLRRQFGIVAQEPAIFAASVAENIRYGRPDASEDDIRAAAKAAFAEEFIAGLRDGYNTMLGERGIRLSGGQKQRLALARALLRQPRILLLDEATSALDAISEKMVQEALHALANTCTILVIAHRLATVKDVDRIIVLEQGRLIAEGSHHTLLRQQGLYRVFAELQQTA